MPACAVLAGLLATGCGASVDAVTWRPNRPPLPAGSVEIFVGRSPERAYERIGKIVARDLMAPSQLKLVARLRDRAARLGCDAIMVPDLSTHHDPHHVTVLEGDCLAYLPRPGAP